MKRYDRRLKQVQQPMTRAIRLDGGEDQTSPALDIKEGDLLVSKNYEARVNGGYERCGNFERYDGRNKPSEASYWTINFDQGSTEFSEGDAVTGATSGATGEVLVPWTLSFDTGSREFYVGETLTGSTSGHTGEIVWVEHTSGGWSSLDAAGTIHLKAPSGTFTVGEVITTNYGKAMVTAVATKDALTSGTWGGADAAGELVLYNVTGTFQDNENLQVSAVTYAVADGTASRNSAPTDKDNWRYLMHAISNVRDDIGTVTGSGIIRGLVALDGTLYVFRDNAGGTAGGLWKATASGWSAISMPEYVDFDAGSIEFAVGDTVTGATSGASATVDAIVIKSGVVGSGNQTGRLYISSVTGGPFQNNENLQVSAVTNAVADGASDTLVIAPGGKVESVVDNFTGDPNDRKIYGVDGVNPAFEFDGTNFYHLVTANTTDAPDHVAVHKNHLFLSFGPSIQHSGLGTPRDFTAISGAVEIATGDDVTGFAKAAGDILVMFNRSSTYLLYGSEATTWERKEHESEAGAIEWSVQNIGRPVYLDDRGLTTLNASDAFGDFRESSISKKIDDYLSEQKGNVLCTMRVKDKNQYRMYFNDGTGLHVRIDRKEPAFTRVEYGKTVYCALSTEDVNGNEVLYFGSDDGYVYQLDVGRSADGAPIEALARFAYWTLGTPRQNKKFLEVVFYTKGASGASLTYSPEMDFGDIYLPRGNTGELDAPRTGGFWGSAVWGQFIWGGPLVGEARASLDGAGTSLGVLVRSVSGHEQNHTIESAVVYYIPRGLKQ